MKRGMNYYSSRETNHYVYFMGNPLLWWMASAAVGLYMSGCIWSVIKYLKGKQETKIERERFGKNTNLHLHPFLKDEKEYWLT